MALTNRSSWSICVVALLAAWAALGCQAKPKLPDDPLFVNHKPIEATPQAAAPVVTAYGEPAMPVDPVALAREKQARPVPGILTSNPGQLPTTGPRPFGTLSLPKSP